MHRTTANNAVVFGDFRCLTHMLNRYNKFYTLVDLTQDVATPNQIRFKQPEREARMQRISLTVEFTHD